MSLSLSLKISKYSACKSLIIPVKSSDNLRINKLIEISKPDMYQYLFSNLSYCENEIPSKGK